MTASEREAAGLRFPPDGGRLWLWWPLAWTAGVVAGLQVGGLLASLLFGATDALARALHRVGFNEAEALWFAPFGAGLWATVGAAQWLALRRMGLRIHPGAWVAASGAAGAVGSVAAVWLALALGLSGWGSALAAGLAALGLADPGARETLVRGVPAMVVASGLVGAAQAPLVAGASARAYAYVWAGATTMGVTIGSVVGWELVAGTLMWATVVLLMVGGAVNGVAPSPERTLAGALKFGLASGATTAVILMRMGRRRRQ
jgi:hypothetical protein